MSTLSLVVLLWCLPSVAIIVIAMVRTAAEMSSIKRLHLHEVFHPEHMHSEHVRHASLRHVS